MGFESLGVAGGNGLLPPSITLTTRLLPLSLHTLTTYREREREGYGGTSTRLYGARARAHATKLYGDFLLSLYNQTPMTTTTAAAAAAAAASTAAATAIFKYYHHSLITLSHPLRLRPLLLETHATRSSLLSHPTETTFTSTEGNFTHPPLTTLLATLLFSNLPPFSFKPPAIFSNLPREGREVT